MKSTMSTHITMHADSTHIHYIKKIKINKINSKVEENVESLKIKDIIYIGEKANVPKEYNKCKCSRHYIRKFDRNKKFLCIYKKQGKIYKFIFEPSDVLIDRIKHSI